jgi:hypothetical protein
MQIRYYLSVNPIEALIASQLTPDQFGLYMAIGRKNGSHEKMMFLEIDGGFGSYFDWPYAEQRCVPHEDGSPKHSVWMSVYRVLENVPLSAMRSLFLTTQDGRTLELDRAEYQEGNKDRDYYVYQELCPITPLVVSALQPKAFCTQMTDRNNKVSVPQMVFADLKVIDFDNPTETGNIGPIYDKNLDHLKDCVLAVTSGSGKKNKNVERSMMSFSYQIIDSGIYIGSGAEMLFYRMKTFSEIRQHHYDWGRSAMIL